NGSLQVEDASPSESTSREAYFSRWAGKPHELSPLVCARYGWANVECDVLKCSSCQAFLCASLQLAFDFAKCAAVLVLAPEPEPCPNPDFPSPASVPGAWKGFFLPAAAEFHLLALFFFPLLRVPALVPCPSLTEEKISLLLQLVREELEHKAEGEKPPARFTSEALPVHVSACVLALCGWTSCPSAEGRAPTAPAERCPPVPTSPRRMLTRSQDAFPPGSEQQEKSPSPAVSRPRAWDSASPVERGESEAAGPTPRSRPVTRSMGQGEAAVDVPSSPVRRAKRARLCSSGSSDASSRSFFDPSSQHRDWCPWVNAVEGAEAPDDSAAQKEPPKAEPGWQAILNVLLAIGKCDRVPETEPVSLSVKSSKVFRIFRQWESANPS
uniref:Zinc finger C3HC-type containing 1 n=1 Tax=Anser cygnoides TaxID=8845 RepID=A0A8B9EZG7_ANSCY